MVHVDGPVGVLLTAAALVLPQGEQNDTLEMSSPGGIFICHAKFKKKGLQGEMWENEIDSYFA